jgi:Tol biopolymer transport system component
MLRAALIASLATSCAVATLLGTGSARGLVDTDMLRSRQSIAERGAEPSWSPDGRTILFVKHDSIWSVGASGEHPRQVSRPGPNAEDGSPTWDPTGRSIVFSRLTVFKSGRAARTLRIRRYAHGQARLISSKIPRSADGPEWHPGRRLVFAASCSPPRLGFSSADGTSVQLVRVPQVACLGSPTWSPHSRAVVFQAQAIDSQKFSLWMTDNMGRRLHRVTRSRSDDVAPAWAPDGQTIAFSRNCRLALLELSSGRVQFIGRETNLATCETDPDWSPDGSRIVFSSRDRLFVIDANGMHRRQIATRG